MRNTESVRNLLQMGSSNLLVWSLGGCIWNAFVSCFVVTDKLQSPNVPREAGYQKFARGGLGIGFGAFIHDKMTDLS